MTTQQSVLVTGGSSGIGLGLAVRYGAAGARVMLTGRSPERLAAAARAVPGAVTVAGDLARPEERVALLAEVERTWVGLDVLVLAAGDQRRVALADDRDPWSAHQHEMDLLLGAPVHLTMLLLPLLLRSTRSPQVVTVTSGGAPVPQPFAPLYSAAKAAVHSWTLTLRHALGPTPVRVTELVPPAVATGLGDRSAPHGADVDEFCDTVVPALRRGDAEVGFGATDTPAFRSLLQEARDRFDSGSGRFPVARFTADAS